MMCKISSIHIKFKIYMNFKIIFSFITSFHLLHPFSYDSKATYDPSWRTDLCITENLMENITRCVCPISGTFVVLLVKKSFNVSSLKLVYEYETQNNEFSLLTFCLGFIDEAPKRSNDCRHLLRLLLLTINDCICRLVAKHLHSQMLYKH